MTKKNKKFITYGGLLKKLKLLKPSQLRQRCLAVDPDDFELIELCGLEIIKTEDDVLPKGRIYLSSSSYV